MLSRILASFTFRFLSAYIAGLSVSVFLVLAAIYAFISYDYFQEVAESVNSELQQLEEAYERGGEIGAEVFIAEHGAPDRLIRFFYIITDGQRNKITGTLEAWPAQNEFRSGWSGFDLELLSSNDTAVSTVFIARSRQLDSGEYVMVARHYADVIRGTRLVSGAITRSMVATLVLGLLGGVVVATIHVRRIDAINRSLDRIMSGDLAERLPTDRSNNDFDRLTRNLNQMLDQIEKLMVGVRQVSDNIAHDLRTPLTRLRNELADLEGRSADDTREQVRGMLEEADNLLATFSALLRISQVESGNRRSGFEQFCLHTVLQDVVELYEPLAMDKEQQLNVAMAKVPEVLGDRNLLFQAFANLVDNAIKYTPDGGSLRVSLAATAESVTVVIADSGAGVPLEDRENVFRRFYRVEASRSQQPGNGLGLSLVKAVVTLHGGKIRLLDNQPGLKVVVSLPLPKRASA